ncbi:MAG TPA: AbrB/MazE/SpoVT family DNA-binding domain-containing protein [Micropepsaceae bacterium]|nr:AbrB/MazE/SpoVT family DNA-binding domain-containing protein [Micropepsaceae bacterium]
MIELKLTQIGNSVGVVIPKEVLAKLNVEKGDTLFLTEGPDGQMLLGSYDPEVAAQVAEGLAFMNKYRDTFRALAK